MYLDLNTIAKYCGGQLMSNKNGITVAKSVSIDTRTIKNGQVFFAIRGDTLDGHDYLDDALKKGAVAAVVDHHISSCQLAQIVVEDTTIALQECARQWRQMLLAKVIVITGSNGKTTVKEMLYSILCTAYDKSSIHCNKHNFNNHLGLPLTLLEASLKHRYVIAEAGMNHTGELEKLSHIAAPNIAIINNAQRAHFGHFSSLQDIAAAKGEILKGLSFNGIAVLNADDQYFPLWSKLISNQKIIPFGTTIQDSLVYINNDHLYWGNYRINIPLLGRHNVMNAAAAATIAAELNLSSFHVIKGLQNMTAPNGRLKPYFLANDSLLIDDSYNANPDSAIAAIEVLKEVATQHNHTPIYVLGDMLELGSQAGSFHQEVITAIKSYGIKLVGTGSEMQKAMQATHTEEHYFPDKNAIQNFIEAQMQTSPCSILIKGSRSMAMDSIVQALRDFSK